MEVNGNTQHKQSVNTSEYVDEKIIESARRICTQMASICIALSAIGMALTRSNPGNDHGRLAIAYLSISVLTMTSAIFLDWLIDSLTEKEWAEISKVNKFSHIGMNAKEAGSTIAKRIAIFSGGYVFLSIIYSVYIYSTMHDATMSAIMAFSPIFYSGYPDSFSYFPHFVAAISAIVLITKMMTDRFPNGILWAFGGIVATSIFFLTLVG